MSGLAAASRSWTVKVGADQTSAVWDPPVSGDVDTCFICAHGAGGNMSDRSILAVTDALRQGGIGTVRFNFFYRARGSSRPDPMPRLLACLDAVVERVEADLNPSRLVMGGRSMGGRAASMRVAERPIGQGLLLLAYPLHPPGQTDKLRDQHLAAITMPVLCLNGTRDAFCERPLMERVVSRLGQNWTMHWLEAADHGFHVLKSSGRGDRDIVAEAADAVRDWVKGLPSFPVSSAH